MDWVQASVSLLTPLLSKRPVRFLILLTAVKEHDEKREERVCLTRSQCEGTVHASREGMRHGSGHRRQQLTLSPLHAQLTFSCLFSL